MLRAFAPDITPAPAGRGEPGRFFPTRTKHPPRSCRLNLRLRSLSPLLLFGLLLPRRAGQRQISRRPSGLPLATSFVLFGVLIGNSGLRLIDPYILDAAQFSSTRGSA